MKDDEEKNLPYNAGVTSRCTRRPPPWAEAPRPHHPPPAQKRMEMAWDLKHFFDKPACGSEEKPAWNAKFNAEFSTDDGNQVQLQIMRAKLKGMFER